MNLKRLTCASATVLAIGAAGLTVTPAVAVAQPGQRCPAGDCRGPGGPGGPGQGFGRPGGFDGPGRPGGPGQGFGRPGGFDGPGRPGGPRWVAPPPPRDLGWRGIDQGRFDRQPFNYRGSWVTPIFNPDFRNWGFWFLGAWIPL